MKSNKNGKMKTLKHKPKWKQAQIVSAESVLYSLFLLVCKFTKHAIYVKT